MTQNARRWLYVAAGVVGVGVLLTLCFFLFWPLLMGPAGLLETEERASERMGALHDDLAGMTHPDGAVLVDTFSYVESGLFVGRVYCVDMTMQEVRRFYDDALPKVGWVLRVERDEEGPAEFSKDLDGLEVEASVVSEEENFAIDDVTECDRQAYVVEGSVPYP